MIDDESKEKRPKMSGLDRCEMTPKANHVFSSPFAVHVTSLYSWLMRMRLNRANWLRTTALALGMALLFVIATRSDLLSTRTYTLRVGTLNCGRCVFDQRVFCVCVWLWLCFVCVLSFHLLRVIPFLIIWFVVVF